MTDTSPTVFVVDDDEAVRDSLELLLAAFGWIALSPRIDEGTRTDDVFASDRRE